MLLAPGALFGVKEETAEVMSARLSDELAKMVGSIVAACCVV